MSDEALVNTLNKMVQPPPPREMTRLRYLATGLRSPYYSLADLPRVIRGVQFSGRELKADAWSADLRELAPRIEVPVYFFLARHDTVLSPALAAEYFRALRAPRGKHLVWFERAHHPLHLEEPERFRAELRRVLADTQLR